MSCTVCTIQHYWLTYPKWIVPVPSGGAVHGIVIDVLALLDVCVTELCTMSWRQYQFMDSIACRSGHSAWCHLQLTWSCCTFDTHFMKMASREIKICWLNPCVHADSYIKFNTSTNYMHDVYSYLFPAWLFLSQIEHIWRAEKQSGLTPNWVLEIVHKAQKRVCTL